VVFCYRISREIFLRRSGAAALTDQLSSQTECSNQSEGFSTLSTTSRD
jgi:hypothetical protein